MENIKTIEETNVYCIYENNVLQGIIKKDMATRKNLIYLVEVDDNVMYIVAMFDLDNQRLLAEKLSFNARYALKLRMLAGGAPSRLIPF